MDHGATGEEEKISGDDDENMMPKKTIARSVYRYVHEKRVRKTGEEKLHTATQYNATPRGRQRSYDPGCVALLLFCTRDSPRNHM